MGPTGDLLLKPEISGIGGHVYSTISPRAAQQQQLMNPYADYSGTSMATPYVAGYVFIYILKIELILISSKYYP